MKHSGLSPESIRQLQGFCACPPDPNRAELLVGPNGACSGCLRPLKPPIPYVFHGPPGHKVIPDEQLEALLKCAEALDARESGSCCCAGCGNTGYCPACGAHIDDLDDQCDPVRGDHTAGCSLAAALSALASSGITVE